MSVLIDLKDYEIKEPFVSKGGKGRLRVKHYLKDPFLKGPIPLRWLVKAAGLGRCALMVGLTLWYTDGMRFQKPFRIGQGKIAVLLEVSRSTVLRGIKRLEAAGLIFVLREPGSKLVVTLNRAVPSN